MDNLFQLTSNELPFNLPDRPGYQAAWNDRWHGFHVTIPSGTFFYSERFFNARWSDRSVEYFLENDRFDWRKVDWRSLSAAELNSLAFSHIRWQQDYLKLYGKVIPLPRLTAWYGDPGKSYEYSGINADPHPWVSGLSHLKNRIEECAAHQFNCVLLNWYRDGQDSLSWHADDEKELGENPVIASANFGATRDFLIRKNDDHSQKLSIPLKHGSLLIMQGEMQHYWQHSVPKRPKVKDNRFNLTFRTIN
ncbi:alpha-ketoglutarate-dependent dioxygenase AlkB family protein [Sphingomonas sp.]|uniref:alpha-ketoglutarate-dependent dioxygenase AlkB family protein n=1 Tax=Sphingomonas sp. TaxID=28214 RepID=UPI003CC51818